MLNSLNPIQSYPLYQTDPTASTWAIAVQQHRNKNRIYREAQHNFNIPKYGKNRVAGAWYDGQVSHEF